MWGERDKQCYATNFTQLLKGNDNYLNKLSVYILPNGCGSYIDDSLQLHNPLLSLLVAVTLQKKQTASNRMCITHGLRSPSTCLTYCKHYVTGHCAVASMSLSVSRNDTVHCRKPSPVCDYSEPFNSCGCLDDQPAILSVSVWHTASHGMKL